MFCTTKVTLYCPGQQAEALPRFQALLEDLAALLRDKHAGIEVHGGNIPLDADLVDEHADSEADFDD